MSARKRVRAYLRHAAKYFPDQQTVARFPGTEISLTVPDLQTLLRSERAARAAGREVIRVQAGQVRSLRVKSNTLQEENQRIRETADVQSRKAAAVVARLQEQNASLRTALANAGQDDPNTLQNTVRELRADNAALRANVSELSKKISDPPGSHERWQKLRSQNASLAAQRDSLQTSLAQAENQIRARSVQDRLAASVPALRRLVEERGQKNRELTAERDRWKRTAEDRDADLRTLTAQRDSLQRALDNLRESVRKGTPPPRTFADTPPFASAPGGPSAEDLRKVAEQLLAVFLPQPRDKK